MRRENGVTRTTEGKISSPPYPSANDSSLPDTLRILVADDNGLNRKILRLLLEAEGHAVVEADNGVAALQVLEQSQVDAVISDILMPEMDGYRLCYEIRRSAKFGHVPFIVYTASYTSESDEKLAFQFGVDKFIRKPASNRDIIDSFNDLLATASKRNQKDVEKPAEAEVMREYSQVLVRKLEETIVELSEANKSLAEQTALAEFVAAVGTALSEANGLTEMLRRCTDAMVKHLKAAFARIWILNEKENVLELQASSGIYTHVDGGHGRIPVGQFKIGLIASERAPHLTNAVIGDARVHDQVWAKREDMVAFAGYPLLIGDQLVGVMATFARTPLSQNTLDVMGTVAQNIAVGVQRQLAEAEVRNSEERFREIAENINEIFFVADPDGGPVHYVSPAYEEITGTTREALYRNPGAWLEIIHAEDQPRVGRALRQNAQNLDEEYRIVRSDGALRWLRSRAFPVKDAAGKTIRVVGIATDITSRKLAEAQVQQNLNRIRALHEIDLAITSTLDLPTVLKILLEKIEVFFSYPTVTTVRLLDRKTGELKALACHNIDKTEWQNSFSGAPGLRARRVLDTKVPLIVRNVATDRETASFSFYRNNGLVSYVGLPLVVRNEALGVLNVYTREEWEFGAEEVEFLMTLAGQAAIAIHNAQLYEETERRRREAEELARLARSLTETLDMMVVGERIVTSVREIVSVEGAALRLHQTDGSLRRLASSGEVFSQTSAGGAVPSGVGLTSRALAGGRPVWSSDILNDPEIILTDEMRDYHIRSGNRSMIAVPLRAHEKLIGALTLSDRTGRTYAGTEVSLLQTFADQAALALENAQLYEQTERHLKRIQGVSEINNAIASTLSLKNVLEVLLEKTELFCPIAGACGVRLFDEASGLTVPLAVRNIPFEEWRQEVANATGRLTQLLIETKRPVAIVNMHTDSRTSMNNFASRYGLVSYLGVPLIVRDQFIGTLVIYTKEEHVFGAEEIDFFNNLGSQAAIAIHHARLYEDARAREAQLYDSNRMLSALHTVGAATSQTLDIDKILKSAIEKITEIFGFDATHIHIYDAKADELLLRAYFETDPARFTTARSFKKGQGIVGCVAESGEALIFDDVQTDPRYRQLSRSKTSGQFGYHFFAVLPIKGRRETFGTLACIGSDIRKLGATETQMLEAITGQIAIALENSTLYQNVREKVDELQQVNVALQDSNRMLSALHAVAAAANQSLDLSQVLQAAIGKITEIFDFDATRIHLLDDDSDHITRRASFEKYPERFTSTNSFRVGQGVVGKVAQSGQPLIFEDVSASPAYLQFSKSRTIEKTRDRFFAVFPIRSKSGTLGTLGCINRDPRKLETAEVQLLEAITDQIAVAIENARLFEKNELSKRQLESNNRFLDQSLKQLGSLYTAMAPLTASESVGDMIEEIISRLMEATGADAALIRLWDSNAATYPVIGQRGYPPGFIEDIVPNPKEGAVGWVMTHDEAIIAPVIATDSRLRGKRQINFGFQSGAFLPLTIHGEVRGVIQLSSRVLGHFDDDQKTHLLAIGRQMSIALENREMLLNLQKSSNELERANKVKDEFLSVMSHELRTPLSVVTGYSAMLRQQQLGPLTSEQEHALNVIQRNSQELYTMIDSIMDATKIETGSMVTEKERVSLPQLLGDIKVGYECPNPKSIQIQWKFSDALPSLWTDPRKLRQILTNLVNNAIKFTDQGSVAISAQENIVTEAGGHRRWIEFRIADSGIGIPPEKREKIFERFYQVDGSGTRSFEGVGLGLYIVKSFTEMLGGHVSVEGDVGKGSTFIVSFPLQIDPNNGSTRPSPPPN